MKAARARKLRAMLAAGVALASLAACYTSPNPRTDPTLRSPLGVHAEIVVGQSRYDGELLAITPTDFTLLTGGHLVVIPFDIAGAGRFRAIDVSTYGAPWRANAEQLKYASRYPYGIPPVALDAILRQRGQTAPDTIKLAPR